MCSNKVCVLPVPGGPYIIVRIFSICFLSMTLSHKVIETLRYLSPYYLLFQGRFPISSLYFFVHTFVKKIFFVIILKKLLNQILWCIPTKSITIWFCYDFKSSSVCLALPKTEQLSMRNITYIL